MLRNWLAEWKRIGRIIGTKKRRNKRQRLLPQPIASQAEVLEKRTLLTNFIVTTLDDEAFDNDTNDGTDGNGLSLREAIGLANNNTTVDATVGAAGMADGDTITFAAGLMNGTSTLSLGQLLITDDVMINGDAGIGGTRITINGGGGNRIFELTTAGAGSIDAVTISNLIITNGSVAANGGGVLVNASDDLALSNVEVSGNTAQFGGGIINLGTASIEAGSMITGNSASFDGGGIFNGAGDTLTVNASTVGNNTAQSGGGIINLGTASIESGSLITGNSASTSGGGIFNGAGDTLTVNDSTVGNNTAQNGGGIFNLGTASIESGSLITGNSASTSGGGIFNSTNDMLTVNNSTVGNNTAQFGGGIRNAGTASIESGSLITGNSATFDGGGIVNDVDKMLTVNASTVGNNTAGDDGGGIFNLGTASIEAGSLITGNSASFSSGGIFNGTDDMLTVNNSTVGNNTAQFGGGIFNLGTATIEAGSMITGNTASVDGGGIFNSFGDMLTVNDSTVGNNTADFGGGINNNGTATIEAGSLITANSATFDGGGIFNSNDDMLTVNDSTVGNNTAQSGGGIINFGTATIESGSMITGNSASLDGGGIINSFGDMLTVNGSTVGNNTANFGGGIVNNGTASIEAGSMITGNSASLDGGGILNNAELNLVGPLTLDINDPDTISGSGNVTSDATGGTVTIADGTLSTYTGTTTLTSGVTLVNGIIDNNATPGDGSAGDVTVQTGATLGGTGTIDADVEVEAGGTISPGTSPGQMTVADLTLNATSTFIAEIDGTAGAGVNPGGHDQVIVTGDVDLGNADLITDQLSQVFVSLDVPQAIPDLGTVTSDLIVAAFSGTVDDVNITLDITHTQVIDLEITLIAPDGTRVDLVSFANFGIGQNFTDTTFDDEATQDLNDGTAPYTGTFRPAGLLRVFDGMDPNGTWTLEIEDLIAGITGTLNSWSLVLTPPDSEITGSMAGDAFVIIDNQGPNMVAGTFNGLAEGAMLTVNGEDFRIFYGGGDGNDVVLASVNTDPDVVYVNDDFAGLNDGVIITDADANTAGDQMAVVGVTAFSSIGAGLAAVNAGGMVLITDDFNGIDDPADDPLEDDDSPNAQFVDDGPGMYMENITINKNVTIQGTEGDATAVIVDGNQAGSVIDNNGAFTLMIDSITIQNGSSTDDGGGIANFGNLTLNNSVVQNNIGEDGGGILNTGTALIQGGSLISGNLANDTDTASGGGIFNTSNGMLTIDDSTVSGNTADQGGGVQNEGTVIIQNMSFITANIATTANGGGVVNTSSLTLDNSTVSNNSAQNGSGGGIRNSGSTTMITGGSIISNNSASGNGGGISNATGSMLTVNDSTVGQNTSDFGGGIRNFGTASIEAGSMITGNSASLDGGGIFNSGDLTLANSIVQNNTANSDGGGIFNIGTATIESGSMITGNSASLDGGGIFNSFDDMLTVNASTVGNNTAQLGGGIFNNGTATIESGSMITGNSASFNGGGIVNDVGDMLTVNDSTVGQNTAQFGGGILNRGTATIESGSMITGNSASDQGGGIFNSIAAMLTVNASTVGNNTAQNGGGIFNFGTASIEAGSMITGNSASVSGGGIFYNVGTLHITDTTIQNNTASGSSPGLGGGGIFVNDNLTLTLDSTVTVSDNIADGAMGNGGGILVDTGSTLNLLANTMITGNSASRAGGGIENNAGTVNLTNATLDNNTAGINGGGLHTSGAGTVTVDGGTITNNLARQEGGGLWNSATGVMDIVSASGMVTIQANIAEGNANGTPANLQGGGGIFNDGGSLDVDNIAGNGISIFNNFALGLDTDGAGTAEAGGSGGGILSIGGMVNILNAVGFTANEAIRAGGGIEIVEGTVNITNSTFIQNDVSAIGSSPTAQPGNGGGLHVTGAANVTIGGGLFDNNQAAREGGAIWNSATGTMSIDGTTISNNTASGDAADDGGGGIFNDGGILNIGQFSPVMITGNIANGTSGSGGGIFNNGGIVDVVFGTTISGNTANSAGGGIEDRAGTLTLNTVTLENNLAGGPSANPGNGGGLHITGASNVSITDGTVNNNTATAEGGGLWNSSTGTMTIDGTLITQNTANGDGTEQGGGGIFNDGGEVNLENAMITMNVATATSANNGGGGIFNDGELNIFNSQIENNLANQGSADGGGILNSDGGSLTITGTLSTVSNNTAARAGGGIENNAGSVTVTNLTMEDNTAGRNGGGIHQSGNGNVQVNNSLIRNNIAEEEGGGLWNSPTGTFTIVGSTVQQNTANGTVADMQGGGGIFNSTGGVFDILGGSTITNNVALGDDAGEGGGGIFNDGQMTIINSSVTNNEAVNGLGNGGGILNDENGTLTITGPGSSISGNEAARAGGGIENNGGTVIMTDAALNTNSAGVNGGGLHTSGAGTVTINGGTVNGNIADEEGGGLWNSATGTMIVQSSGMGGTTINGNMANGDDGPGAALQGGGGIFNLGGPLNVTDASITNNAATGATNGSGGGILSINGTVNITETLIDNNEAVRAGGGIELVSGTVTVTNTDITNNDVSIADLLGKGLGRNPGNGGGLHVTATATVNLSGGNVSSNTASEEGGGLWNSATGVMTVDNVAIQSNIAQGFASLNAFGGGIFNNGGTLIVQNDTLVDNNQASGTFGSGGGIFNSFSGTVTVTDSTISNNTARRAGGGIEDQSNQAGVVGISLSNVMVIGNHALSSPTSGAPGNGGGLHVTGQGDVMITNSFVINNSARAEGGGLWNDDGGMLILNTQISGNTASGNSATQGGGGVFNDGGQVLIMSNAMGVQSQITNNIANGTQGSGGGVFNDVGGTLNIFDSSITNNTANRAGGGIEDNVGESTFLANVLLSGNTATGAGAALGNGGGLHITGAGNVQILGGTISNNSAAEEGGGLWNSGTGTLEVGGNLNAQNLTSNIQEATGANAASIQATVDNFRATLGALNPNEPGSRGEGRREINWDGGPNPPDPLPGNFFNTPTGPRTRGIEFQTDGTGFKVSPDAPGPIEFGDINATYPDDFEPFSAQRLFTPTGSNFTLIQFFVPGTNIPATVRGFGAVFSDVDRAGSTIIEFLDVNNTVIESRIVPATLGDQTFSFVGVSYDDPVIAQVRIVTGDQPLGAGVNDGDNGIDLVVLDDFIFGEPVPLPAMDTIITNNTASGDLAENGGGGIFNDGGTLTVTNITISGNTANGANGSGGGIQNQAGTGTTTVTATTISGNIASTGDGGGIANSGDFTLMDSTVSGNTATTGDGGGITSDDGQFNLFQSTISGNSAGGNGGGVNTTGTSAVDINNATITDNTATTNGGGLHTRGTRTTLLSTIIAGNFAPDATPNDVDGTIDAASFFNLIGINTNLVGITDGPGGNQVGTGTPLDPMLGALADNGGPTQTHLLLPGSTAIERGLNFRNFENDQRQAGFFRTIGESIDAGAVEFQRSLTVVGSGDGRVRIFDSVTNAQLGDFQPYGAFTGEVRVAVGDVSGDGVPDIITTPGTGGGPLVLVFDGASPDLDNPTLIRFFYAYDQGFTGGVYVAAANLNPLVDNNVDIITGAGATGGPHVRAFSGVFNGTTPAVLQDFFAFPAAFTGGVRVAAGDITGDGVPDIIAGAGPGETPTVRVFDGSIPQLNAPIEGVSIPGFLGTFHAFDASFSGGVFVASGDVDGNGRDDIIVSQGASTDPNADPRVTVFSGLNSQVLTSFLAYDAGFQGGVTVGSVFGPDVNGIADIITGAGPGTLAEPNLNVFSGQNGTATNINSQNPFGPGFTAGIFVAGASPTPQLATAAPLLFGGGEIAPGNAAELTQSQLNALAQAALVRLGSDDIPPVDFRIADLADGVLGQALNGVIQIDITASGAGWFIDPSPLDDIEFDQDLNAQAQSALGRVDLLTVILHELGHHLGGEDLSILEHPQHLMAESLTTGKRRLPVGELDQLFSDSEQLGSLLS